jgi:hypothetical protein
MAADPDGKSLTVNYPGGALTTTVGAWKSLFGVDSPILQPIPESKTVGVKTHPRVRVIGKPSTQVDSYTYEYTQWPTSQASNAAAGDVVLLEWDGSDGQWTGRVTGALSDLASFFRANSIKPVVFRSERGTKYGPFQLVL